MEEIKVCAKPEIKGKFKSSQKKKKGIQKNKDKINSRYLVESNEASSLKY